MNILEKRKILNFIYKNWKNEEGQNGVFDYFNEEFEKISQTAFNDLTNNIKKPTNNHYLIRIAGQSGSGKTTQLMPAIKSNLDNLNQNYVLIAVRLFVKYHPKYNELLEKYGKSLIREKTNGFALLLLIRTLEKLIENKYNILFEVTLIEPIFEEYIIKLCKNYKYKMCFNVLSVNENLSNNWILKRKNNSGNETNRIVYKSSSSYFYDILPKSLKIIIDMENYFDKNDFVIIWNAFDKNPCLETNIFNETILNIYEKYRTIDNTEKKDNEDKLREFKTEFYNKFFDRWLK